MNQEEFEELIISFVQGSSTPNFADVIDQMLHQEENLLEFVNSLFDLLFITKNETALKSSLILLSSLLSKKWSENIFDEKWVEEKIKKLISFYHKNDFLIKDKSTSGNGETDKNQDEIIDNEKMYIFANLVSTIAQNIKQYNIFENFENKYSESDKNELSSIDNLKDLTFEVCSIYLIYNHINISKIEVYYENILDVLKRALESHKKNFENAIKSIYILSFLLDFCPDEKEVINDHIDIIISLANESDKLPSNLFINLWKSICSFLYSEACSNDISLVTQFHPSVFKICSLDSISSDFKIFPLRSIWSCACDYDRPIIHQIINLVCEVASDYVTQSHSLPFDFLFIFDKCFHDFDHNMIYQYTRQLIISFLNSENYSNHIVGLCLLRYMVLNLPHEVFHDTDSIINEVEKGLKSDDDLKIEMSSIIISSCSYPISSSLIDVDSLMPQFIPFLVHSNPDVRYYATEACETLLSYSRQQISIPGISLMVFNLVTKVPMEDMPRFLKLLSKCIRHDIKLNTDLAVHFAKLTYSMMTLDSKENDFYKSMIGGSCYVSISLMSMDERTHEILLPRTMEIISNSIQNDDQLYKKFGIAMLNKLMKIFPKESSQLFNSFSDSIEVILESNNDDSLDRRKGIIDLSSIISLNGDENHPFIPRIIEIAKNWLNSGHHSLIGCGIKALKNLQYRPILPKDTIIDIFQCMSTVITQTKSFDIACSCANAMAFCVNHCTASSEAHDEIVNIGYQVGISYIKGEMLILQGVSPVGTDLEFNLIYSMSILVRELFTTPCDIMRFFFPFIESIIHRNNNLNTEVMMICLVSALKNDALIEEEIEKTKKIVLSFFINEIPKELLCTEIELITTMLDKEFITKDDLNDDRLNTLKNWLEICTVPSEKSKMKAASAGIVLLLWKLVFNFKIRNKIEDSIISSFQQFPPKVVSYTPEMINLAKKCVELDTDAPEIIILKLTRGMLKLMSLSKMNLKNRGVDDEHFNTCKSILRICLNRSQKAQQITNDFANKSEINKSIFQEFIA